MTLFLIVMLRIFFRTSGKWLRLQQHVVKSEGYKCVHHGWTVCWKLLLSFITFYRYFYRFVLLIDFSIGRISLANEPELRMYCFHCWGSWGIDLPEKTEVNMMKYNNYFGFYQKYQLCQSRHSKSISTSPKGSVDIDLECLYWHNWYFW